MTPDLHRLTDLGELALIKLMAGWPRVVESAAEAHEPHRIAFYLYDLAAAFHGLWNRGKEDAGLRFLLTEDPALTSARPQAVAALLRYFRNLDTAEEAFQKSDAVRHARRAGKRKRDRLLCSHHIILAECSMPLSVKDAQEGSSRWRVST